MKYRALGTSDLTVSELCLGTMTWGTQNTEAEGHRQIDIALDRGVNFIDTAEIYPTNPVRAETAGGTEAILGTWIGETRATAPAIFVLATKVRRRRPEAMRGGAPITARRCCGRRSKAR